MLVWKIKSKSLLNQGLEVICFSVVNCLRFPFCYLFLVPFEVWEENKTNVWVWVFVDDPLCLGLLLQDVVYPLFGAERDA